MECDRARHLIGGVWASTHPSENVAEPTVRVRVVAFDPEGTICHGDATVGRLCFGAREARILVWAGPVLGEQVTYRQNLHGLSLIYYCVSEELLVYSIHNNWIAAFSSGEQPLHFPEEREGKGCVGG